MSLVNVTLSNLSAVASDASSSSSSVPLVNYGLVTTIVVGLSLFGVIVVTALGNLLVAIALFRYRSLRTISNYLIGNLALSDFLLATTILPLSTINECLGHWVFGRATCNVWLIGDVLYCTASIWNLCLIAFDRFTATLYPMWYRDKRSTKQAALYVTLVWVIASAISVPPLLGWNDLSQNYVVASTTSTPFTPSTPSTSFTTSTTSRGSVVSPGANDSIIVYYCMIFQTPSYVLYSASGSFFLPFFITFALYVKIFCVLRQRMARSRSMRSLRRKVLKNNSLLLLTPTDHHERTPLCRTFSTPLTSLDLGSHFNSRQFSREDSNVSETSHVMNDTATAETVAMTSFSRIFSRVRRKGADKAGVSTGGNGALSRAICHPVVVRRRRILSTLHESRGGVVVEASVAAHRRRVLASLDQTNVSSKVQQLGEEEDDDNDDDGDVSFRVKRSLVQRGQSPLPPPPLPPPSRTSRRSSIVASFRSLGSLRSIRDSWNQKQQQQQQQQHHFDQMEMRATMRMAVIIGAFCGMWLGFFTTYILNGWCDVCEVPRELDAFFFWLGYLNSTVNPILYTIFNDDFRRAFKKILGCTDPSRLSRRTFARKV